MEPQILYIDDMVCQRCILSVEKIMTDLGWTINSIKLGEVRAVPPEGPSTMDRLVSDLVAIGFQVLDDQHSLASQVRSVVIEHVYNDRVASGTNLSDLITAVLFKEYSYISRKFSAATGRTIEAYYTDQRMERGRKLLATTNIPISDISSLMKYAAPSHFAAAFRRAEGVTPSAYRKLNDFVPSPLDQV
jgi:AraC-like DNA-binding protein